MSREMQGVPRRGVAASCRARSHACAILALTLLPHLAFAADPPSTEGPAGRILYHEESGGLVTSVPRPSGLASQPRSAIAPAAKQKQPELPAKPAPVARAKPRPPAPAIAPVDAPAAPAREPTEREAYRAILERFATAAGTAGERAAALSSEAQPFIVQFRDAGMATRLGWLWLEAKDPASAALWFGRARTWSPDSVDALRGLAVAAQAERDYARALALATELPGTVAERESMRQAALIGLAERDYRAERFVDAAERFDAASRAGPLPRYARALHAWTLLRLGNRRSAGDAFALLYREAPDVEAAQGLMAAARDGHAVIDPALAAIEPLASLVRKARAANAYSARRFIEAGALDPARYGAIGASSAPQVAGAERWREKSGEEGLTRLHTRGETLQASVPLDDATNLGARWNNLRLDAGTPGPDVLVGTALAREGGPARTTAHVSEPALAVRWEHGVAIDGLLGASPGSRAIGSRALGAATLTAAAERGEFSVSAQSQPVRESVLSYAGMLDPGGTGAWGRVFRHGVGVRGLWLERSPWSLGARASAARLEGVRVADNTYVGADVSAGYDLRPAGFSYASLSVNASWERYAKNLSHFTVGHGGYFSPGRYRGIGAAFDFMTGENQPWMARGRASAARVEKREDAAAWFPLAPDGRMYPGSRGVGNDLSLQLAAACALGDHVQVGVALARGLSPQYRETQAMVQLRIVFEPRARVASTDLPVILR